MVSSAIGSQNGSRLSDHLKSANEGNGKIIDVPACHSLVEESPIYVA